MDQQRLMDICDQDIITFTEMPQSDRDLVWDKRHYLRSIPGALPKVIIITIVLGACHLKG